MKRTAAEQNLRKNLIRLAHSKPELRSVLLPLLKSADDDGLMAGRTWGNPNPGAQPDDADPYNIHPDSPSAGTDGSEQRKKYNQWFRENVCPTHKTNCGMGKKK